MIPIEDRMRAAAHALLGAELVPDLSWESDLAPRPLHRARFHAGQGAYLKDLDREYRTELQQRWMVARLHRVRRRLTGDLLLAVIFWGASQHVDRIGRRRALDRPDADNMLKAIADAGNDFLWDDDRQIRSPLAHIEEWAPGTRPRIWLEVWRWPRARR
jgi:Holliday junction resolvase RusA-like endonuclease